MSRREGPYGILAGDARSGQDRSQDRRQLRNWVARPAAQSRALSPQNWTIATDSSACSFSFARQAPGKRHVLDSFDVTGL